MALKFFGENSLSYLIGLIKGKFIAKPSGGAGSATQPVYINSDGVPTATTYSLEKSVPSNAKFTDTTYSAGDNYIDVTSQKIYNRGVTGIVASRINGSISVQQGTATTGSDITVYTHPSHTSKSSGFYKVTVDSQGHVSGATAVTASDITGLVGTIPTISTNVETDKASDAKTVSPKAVVTYVSEQLSSTYKPKGTLAPSGIIDALLVKASVGNVYNISGSFTTTASFVEGAGNVYPAGTNIVVINTGTAASPSYKFDVLAGFVDLSGYATKSDLSSTTYFAELSDAEVKNVWDAAWA